MRRGKAVEHLGLWARYRGREVLTLADVTNGRRIRMAMGHVTHAIPEPDLDNDVDFSLGSLAGPPTAEEPPIMTTVETDAPKNELVILDSSGDTKLIWDRNNDVERQAAKEQFTKLVGHGYAAFKVNEDGSKGEQIRTFDQAEGKVILAPALRGG